MRTALVVLLLLAVALVWFNPGMDEFSVFAEAQAERLVRAEAGEGEFGRFLSGIGGMLAGQYVDRVTERRNYLLFSVYTIDFDAEAEGDEWQFLGIAGQFVQLDEPDQLETAE